ncbi:L,D-transpeptidase catalytic domain [anaerobic digester metagenome]
MLESVRKLQEQFGYNTDGAIGKNALKALNMTMEQRIDKLYVNMERLRWMPDSLEHTYIQVNIADFSLDVFREGDTLLRMRTIVGKEYRETPVFNARITYLVFSPSWTVPPTIQRNDVIPEVRRNTGYLAGKNMKVYDSKGRLVDPASVNWSRDGMRYTIRQSPGAQNALGKVKFMFPNKHNVYLHDTPSRNLFARDERTFSSGCIRIEKPYDLALILMSDMEGWTPERIRQAMDAGVERTVVLKNPAGVYLTYLTAWATKEGVIHYRSDIYNRDAEMLKALKDKHTKWNT